MDNTSDKLLKGQAIDNLGTSREGGFVLVLPGSNCCLHLTYWPSNESTLPFSFVEDTISKMVFVLV